MLVPAGHASAVEPAAQRLKPLVFRELKAGSPNSNYRNHRGKPRRLTADAMRRFVQQNQRATETIGGVERSIGIPEMAMVTRLVYPAPESRMPIDHMLTELSPRHERCNTAGGWVEAIRQAGELLGEAATQPMQHHAAWRNFSSNWLQSTIAEVAEYSPAVLRAIRDLVDNPTPDPSLPQSGPGSWAPWAARRVFDAASASFPPEVVRAATATESNGRLRQAISMTPALRQAIVSTGRTPAERAAAFVATAQSMF
ncbi:MAG: hypothetical protein IPL40_00210 [Proteobacteria bacterium]|nr:hypothetical protein [Pseudomonadota bacterium]